MTSGRGARRVVWLLPASLALALATCGCSADDGSDPFSYTSDRPDGGGEDAALAEDGFAFTDVAPGDADAEQADAEQDDAEQDDAATSADTAADTAADTNTASDTDTAADIGTAADIDTAADTDGGVDAGGDVPCSPTEEQCNGLDDDCDGATDGPGLCDDGEPCTIDLCAGADGCTASPATGACDDGDACTADDTCLDGACAPGEPVACAGAGPCLAVVCDPTKGCLKTALDLACDDGDPCTADDACAAGSCVGGPAPTCDDGDPCTDDSCVPGDGCASTPVLAGPCDDGDACTLGESCGPTGCAGGTKVVCDDGNPCTVETCEPPGGCVDVAGAAPCADGNDCTLDDCHPITGCSVTPVDAGACDDGNPCSGAGACAAGQCVAGPPLLCDDDNPCTVDACLPVAGCVHQPVADPLAQGCGPQVIELVAGGAHTCARTHESKLWCWGDNANGQLGTPPCGQGQIGGAQTCDTSLDLDKSTMPYGITLVVHERSAVPLEVPLPGAVAGMCAGDAFTCARLETGAVRCWGAGEHGQLGHGQIVDESWQPVDVAGLGGVVELVCGDAHACARDSAGAVRCWGRGDAGQLGDGQGASSATPVLVEGLLDVQQLAAGGAHTCARLATGAVQCWGSNQYGQLGNGTNAAAGKPVAVKQLDDAVSVHAGSQHTCVLLAAGSVRCWGRNAGGQLGNATKADQSTPVLALGLSSVAALDTGAAHTCAARTNGDVWCWGQDVGGAFKPGTTEWLESSHNKPTKLDGVGGAIGLAAGGKHTCARLATGKAACWGNHGSGQLGTGHATYQTAPRLVAGLAAVTELVAGSYHSYARLADGSVYGWGQDAAGQLGDGKVSSVHSLVQPVVGLPPGVEQVVAGAFHGCARLQDGSVRCWGENKFGQLGRGNITDAEPVPAPVVALPPVTSLQAGIQWTCALDTAGTPWCWGDNTIKITPPGTAFVSAVPKALPALGPATALTAGGYHVCALGTDGQVRCLGLNYFGELGDGTTVTTADAVLVGGLPGDQTIVELTSGEYHTCARYDDGSLWCWGAGFAGQTGQGAEVFQMPTPKPVPLLGPAALVTAGTDNTCTIDAAGGLSCWGLNDKGQVGNGSTAFSVTSPTAVLGVPASTQMATGDGHSCAVTNTGEVWCWGFASSGQLGDGACFDLCRPTEVVNLP